MLADTIAIYHRHSFCLAARQLFEHPDRSVYLTASRAFPVTVAFLGFLMQLFQPGIAAFGAGYRLGIPELFQ